MMGVPANSRCFVGRPVDLKVDKGMEVDKMADSANDLISPEFSAALTDPRSYGQPAQVHDLFQKLRTAQPIGKVVAPNVDPFWLITKHEDILEIERQADIFHNGDMSTVFVPADMLRAVQSVMNSPHLSRSMVNMDGKEHRIYRSLTQGWFMPANVKKLTDRIKGIAKAHVDRMFERGGECDFVADVALHYPLHVVMDILGVPEEDEGKMLVLTQQLFGARDPEMSRSAADMSDPTKAIAIFQAVLGDFYSYFSKISEDRRANPRDDLATVIANAVIDGEPISDKAANDYYVLVATAGHDTTSASTAGAILALAENPDQLAKLQADPSLIGGLVDEAIRWVTPVKHFMRSATQDYELRGRTIRAGDWLMLSYMSANRDEDVFERPYEFDVTRAPNKQVAFGFGAHLCIGQHLARLEMRILLEELISRLKTLELAGDVRWTQSVFVSGPKHLPIRFTHK